MSGPFFSLSQSVCVYVCLSARPPVRLSVWYECKAAEGSLFASVDNAQLPNIIFWNRRTLSSRLRDENEKGRDWSTDHLWSVDWRLLRGVGKGDG